MQELIHQLGIDWRLLISQAVNFGLLLMVLRIFAYKPLLKIMKDRRARIEEGLTKAKEADRRLDEVNVIAKNKLKETDRKALEVLRQTEEKAKHIEAKLLDEAKIKESELLRNAELLAESKKKESEKIVREEAVKLVKNALVKTVNLKPEAIDEALIKKAVEEVSSNR